VGLDICLSVADFLSGDGEDTVPERLRDQVAAGKTGRKSGCGFYRYKKGKPVKPAPGKNVHQPPDLVDRLIMRMLIEVVACLREKIVEDEGLLDAGMIFGTGFAPFHGGPCHYIKTVGKNEIHEKLQFLQDKYGGRFTPDKGFSDHSLLEDE
jgi:3-hydroxyacyl-CoA dehydrogenase/enoyl-CoA hydratase/3-hydroxybutyryl-CoA epimerase